MADHHQIVEQIRAFLQGSDQTRSERLEGLATAYAEACTAANQRLSRCHRLLEQGLRSEAIQQAEAEPRILDVMSTLDFPERSEWDELVDIYAMAAPPKPLSEARAALSEAYALAEPLQNLLRTHRRLATGALPCAPASASCESLRPRIRRTRSGRKTFAHSRKPACGRFRSRQPRQSDCTTRRTSASFSRS